MINVIYHTCIFMQHVKLSALEKHIGASRVKIYIFILNFNISKLCTEFHCIFIIVCCKLKETVYFFFYFTFLTFFI